MAGETVQQEPFTPLGGVQPTSALQPMATMDTSIDQVDLPSPTMFGQQYIPSPQQRNREATQTAQQSMAQVEKVTGGVMPTLLATAAALKGDFGPAITLQRQKEQTAIGKAVIPVLAKINDLRINGQYEEAYALANQSAVSAGDRSPEVSKIFQAATADIGRKQQDWANTQHAASLLMDQIKIDAERTGTKPQDDIRYTQAQALKKAAGRRDAFSEAFINNQMVQSRVHTQVGPGGNVTQTTEGGMAVAQTPMQLASTASQIEGYIADTLGPKYNMDATQLTNAKNGKPVLYNGVLTKVSPEITQAIQDDISRLQAERAHIDIGLRMPKSPAYVEAATNEGIPNAQIAMGAGGMSPGVLDAVDKWQMRRMEDVSTAQHRAMQRVPAEQQPNMHPINPRTGIEYPHMTPAEAHAKGIPILDDTKIGPARLFHKSVQHLDLLNSIADTLPDANSPLSRIAGGVNRELNSRLGTNPNYTYAQTLQAIIHRDIEGYFNARGVDSTQMKNLAAAMTGPNATKQGFLEASRGLNDLLQRDYTLMFNQDTRENMPKSLQPPAVDVPVQSSIGQRVTPGIKKGTLGNNMAEPTGKLMDAVDSKGGDVVIYDTTGKGTTEANFSKAMDEYNKNGVAPQGYIVLQPGRTNEIRQMFETGNKWLQDKAKDIANLPSAPILPSVGTDAQGNAVPQIGYGLLGGLYNTAKGMAPVLADQVSTPAKLGMTVGLGAAAPLMKGASVATEAGGLALSKANVMGNMLKAGLAGAGGAAIGRGMTGEGFDVGKTATEFGLASMAGGIQSILGHWITKYITPDKQEGVAKQILDSIVEKYPNMKNDPNLLRSYVTAPENLKRVTQQMAGGLRGSLDDITDNIMVGIKDAVTAVPTQGGGIRALTTGQQNTVRANIRKINEIGNEYLDNVITDPKRALELKDSLSEAQKQLVGTIQSFYPNVQNFGPIEAKLTTTLLKQQNDLNHFKEGAEVLGWLQKSGADKGYNHERFSGVINDIYQQKPGSLLEHVGDILGQGKPLVGPGQPASSATGPPDLMNEVVKLLKGKSSILKYLIGDERKQPTLLSWRQPGKPSTAFTIGAQQGVVGGADAMRSFVGDDRR